MKIKLSEIISSPRAILLDTFVCNPKTEFTITDLTEKSGLSRPTVYKEIRGMQQKSLISCRGGKPKYFKANTKNDVIRAFLFVVDEQYKKKKVS